MKTILIKRCHTEITLTQSGCSLGKVYCKLDFLLQTPLLLHSNDNMGTI